MELGVSLAIYLGVLIVLTWVFYKGLKRNLFPSFVLALVISMIVLIGIHPPSEEDLNNVNSSTAVYFLVLFGSFLIFFLYLLIAAGNDTQTDNNYFEI